MAKRIKNLKRAKVALATPEDFGRARDLLRQRGHALIIELAKRYQAGNAEELANVLNTMDSAAELERMGEANPRVITYNNRSPGTFGGALHCLKRDKSAGPLVSAEAFYPAVVRQRMDQKHG
jgi:hypothetical protein